MINQLCQDRHQHRKHRATGPRTGFTLIEMMVSVTLVLVMMVLFAEVFQIASSSMSKTRGLAENDQRARTLQTILKADLDKRTMRWVYPFAANENPAAPESNIGKRNGYLYYSENNPFNDLDDSIQFTVMSTVTIRNKDLTPYYGQAMNLARPTTAPAMPPYLPPPYLGQNFGYNNQPDADDAQLNPNNTGLSTVAEIVYFVRNGNLYRRQLLVREPLSVVGNNPQPADARGLDIFNPSGSSEVLYPVSYQDPANPTTFWADFDYAASFRGTASGAGFLGTDSLSNSGQVSVGAISFPPNRFGFCPALTGGIGGRAKEFISNAQSDDLANYIGRYTMAECSDNDFRYPQNLTTGGNNPMHPNVTLTLDPNDKTVIGPDDFSQGTRRGEDLMLSNVHAFDVQLWDDGIRSFVNVGDSTLAAGADYARSNRLNFSYGPRLLTPTSTPPEVPPTIVNAVFDTWHPQIDIDGNSGKDNPPFRPLLRVASSTLGGAGPYSDEWSGGQAYNVGDIVFPSGPPGSLLASPPYPSGAVAKLPYGQPFFYRCIFGGTSGPYSNEPSWPRADGLTVNDGTVIWQAVDNRKPLKAIRIQIRFLDTSTQQLRQLTIVHSLVD